MNIDRRDFLKRAGLVGGAALAAPALAGCRQLFPFLPGLGRSLLDVRPSDSPVTHVVVLMMENRSFDHYLGWMATDHAFIEAGRHRYGRHFSTDGQVHQTYPGPNGPVSTAPLVGDPDQPSPYRGCGYGDPGHGWTQGRAERDGGFLAPGSGNDELALGYYLDRDLPFTSELARRFLTYDRYHASLLGPTYPNREYLHSAQSGGNKTNYLPIAEGGFQWDTIWQRLDAAGVPCRYYYSDLPVTALWGPRMNKFNVPIANYFTDCAAGALPNVTFLDPRFIGEDRNDDHPLADVRAGQAFIRDVFKAFAQSPHWQNGAFVVTYDEWGGFFDHVAPPHFQDDRASAVDVDDFSQAGFRVPTVVASPYAPIGYVDHRTYDHTSVLRFLEWRFLGAPPEGPGRSTDTWFLTKRDRYAANLGAALRARRVRTDVDIDLDVAIAPQSPPCAPDTPDSAASPNQALRSSGGSTATLAPAAEKTDFEKAAESGYFERVGAKILD
jgi:phospholipase C